jgi:predicted GIY-YIG superfamily endonuclease
MPDYSKSKIYKLQCDDGYYYIGSTCNDLRKRFWLHKADSKRRNYPVYQHINNEWNKVRIVLIEDYCCENKEQLVRKEDEHIRNNQTDTFCLNSNRAYLTQHERIELDKKCNKNWEIENREKRNRQARERYEKKKLSQSNNDSSNTE